MTTAARPQQRQDPAAEQRRVALVRRDEILDFVGKYSGEIEKLAPRGANADYYVASLRLYFAQNEKLLDCRPLSIAQGILRVAQTGLQLGVGCDLLPFKDVCQFSPRYTGIIELALNAGTRSVNAQCVREGDDFDYQLGTEFFLRHKKVAKSTAPITHAYAIAEIKQQAFVFDVIDRDEIDATRRQYSKSWWKDKSGNIIPLEQIPWYGKKTGVRRISGFLPKNPRLSAALMYAAEEEIPEASFEIQGERTDASDEPVLSGAPKLIEGEEFQDDRDLDDFPRK